MITTFVKCSYLLNTDEFLKLRDGRCFITNLQLIIFNRPNLQIPQCNCPIFHKTPLWNRNVYISVSKWCIVGYGTGALWDFLSWYISNCSHSWNTRRASGWGTEFRGDRCTSNRNPNHSLYPGDSVWCDHYFLLPELLPHCWDCETRTWDATHGFKT